MTSWPAASKTATAATTPIPATGVRRAFARYGQLIAVGGAVLLALGLRMPHLTVVPQFTDESLEVLWSLPMARGEALPLTNYDAYYGALFNYLVAGSFLVLGPGAIAARLLVLLVGVATVLATFGLARAWGGTLAGLLAAGLLAMNAAHIVINSHIAWSNCITPFFTTLATWSLWSAVAGADCHRRSGLLIVLSGLLWGLALQTHPAVVTLLPGVAAFVLWRGRSLLRTPWPYLGLAAFLIGYGNMVAHNLSTGFESLIAAQRLRQQYATDQDAFTTYPGALAAELLLVARVLGGAVDARDWPWEYVLDLPALVGAALVMAGSLYLARRGNPLPLLLAVSCLALLPGLNPKFRTLMSSRYFMPVVPILLAAGASLLAVWLRRDNGWRWAGSFAVLLLVAAPVLGLTRYYERAFASGENNERAYRLASQISQLRRPDEPVVVDESFGSETGGGVSELRALRYLLTFQETPVRVIKITPRRLEDELDQAPSIVTVLNGRQLAEFQRLPLEPLTALPARGSEVGLFRLAR